MPSFCRMWHSVHSASFKKFSNLLLLEANQPNNNKMKFIGLVLALFCAVAYVAAEEAQENLSESEQIRLPRAADPQGSVVIRGEKPMSGPDKRPSLDIDYNQRVFERQGINGNAYGGINIRPGQPPNPRIGMNIEKTYKNGGFGGFGHVERGPGGRPSPVFGVGGRFTF